MSTALLSKPDVSTRGYTIDKIVKGFENNDTPSHNPSVTNSLVRRSGPEDLSLSHGLLLVVQSLQALRRVLHSCSRVVGLHSRASFHVKPCKGQLLDVSQLFIFKLQVYSPAVALEFDISTAP